MKIPITQIIDTAQTQCRHAMSASTIQSYADSIRDGDEFPPIKCVFSEKALREWKDGTYYIWDGFHTLNAFRKLGILEVDVEVTAGTLDDAKWLAVAANKTHGLTRTVSDKNMAVQRALAHPKGKKMSNREIAEWVGVSHTFVNDVKAKQAETPDKDVVLKGALEAIEDNFPEEADAIREGTLDIPEKDLVEFAARPADEQERLAPYLFGHRMSMKQADQVVQYRPSSEGLPVKDYLDYSARTQDGTFYFRDHAFRIDIVSTKEEMP